MIYNAKYVPNLAYNLLSIGELIANGFNVVFAKDQCSIQDARFGSKLLAMQKYKNNLFLVEFRVSDQVNAAIAIEEEALICHRRFGHLQYDNFRIMNQCNMLTGLPKLN